MTRGLFYGGLALLLGELVLLFGDVEGGAGGEA